MPLDAAIARPSCALSSAVIAFSPGSHASMNDVPCAPSARSRLVASVPTTIGRFSVKPNMSPAAGRALSAVSAQANDATSVPTARRAALILMPDPSGAIRVDGTAPRPRIGCAASMPLEEADLNLEHPPRCTQEPRAPVEVPARTSCVPDRRLELPAVLFSHVQPALDAQKRGREASN